MITGQIKNQIDQIWDTFWTGGISNSIDILEQMTYLFFMKLLDDKQLNQEATAAIIGQKVSNPTFGEGNWHNPDQGRDVPFDDLRWSRFKNFEPTRMFQTVSQDVFSFIKHLNSGKESAYSRFMESAIFLIQSPRNLVKIVEGINSLDMNNRDTMGDVYEYILGKMAASGNNGQFRTPRHIIRMMVDMMKPTLDDTICDPAMGSAGFIVESAKYITEHYRTELMKKDRARHFRTTMLNGFDTDPKMLRIGAMNLMLHGVDSPTVEFRDSLSTDNTDENRYTLILANPPFSGSLDNEAVAKSLLAIANTKKTELLFISLFLRSLQIGGRCASIVPTSALTGLAKDSIAVRKNLIEKHRLEAVISMPPGVFNPYSPIATSIIIFTKTNYGGTDKVWFFDMKADGFSLDKKRDAIPQNDIPIIIERFHNLDKEISRSRAENSFFVPVDEIIDKKYDLTFKKYSEVIRESVHYESPSTIMQSIEVLEQQIIDIDILSLINNAAQNTKWEYRRLGDVCIIERGGSPRPIKDFLTDSDDGVNWIKIGDAQQGSKYITSTKEKIIHEGVAKSRMVYKGDFILSNSMSFGRPYILAIDGCIHDGWLAIRNTEDYFDKDFLYYFLSAPSTYRTLQKMASDGVVSNLNTVIVSDLLVPIVPISLQKQIVCELDSIYNAIDVKKQQIERLHTLLMSRMDYWFN